jgi:tripartite-type tricarboxylate transporter receptor subunit TctC
MRKSLKVWFAVAALFISVDSRPSWVLAESFPLRPVKIVMPMPAGGLADTLTRALAQELTKKWAQPVVVENRTGGGGVVATLAVSKSSPDGCTILLTNSALYLTTSALRANAVYDPMKDLEPVVCLARTSDVLLTNPKSPIKSVQDLIEIARAKPGELNYGSFGPGSATHLDMESLALVAGIKLVHIPTEAVSTS